jgi:hypothetical protein
MSALRQLSLNADLLGDDYLLFLLPSFLPRITVTLTIRMGMRLLPGYFLGVFVGSPARHNRRWGHYLYEAVYLWRPHCIDAVAPDLGVVALEC